MPNDFVTLNALSCELNSKLNGGKINKITMLSSDTLLIAARANGQNHNIIISSSPNAPCVYISTAKHEGLDIPPSFCMLLRKHLIGATIDSVEMFNHDRIMSFNLSAKNELRDNESFNLFVELMGASSNIILVDKNLKIIDAIKRVFESKSHVIIPNLTYEPPIKKENSLGFSKETFTEFNMLCQRLDEESCIDFFNNIYFDKAFCPSVTEKGVYVYPYQSVNDEFTKFDEINKAYEHFYGKLAQNEQKQRDTKEIRSLIKRLRTRLDKRIQENKEKLANSDKIEQFKQHAEILKCNLFNIRTGYSILNCFDFYNNIEIQLPIDASISPKKNLEAYFKKYLKAKGAYEYAAKEKDDLNLQDTYLRSIEASILSASTKADYNELKEELLALTPKKGLKGDISNKKIKKPQKNAPLMFNIDGFKVYVGKTNVQNEEVTFKIADSDDIWLHVKDYHGSHTIIKTEGKQIPNSVIQKAASIAAFYSECRNSNKITVDYTKRRYVKKLTKIGLVSYNNHKSIVVEPKVCI